MARDGGAERGSEVKAEMMRALEGLEGLVREGRASISRERSRQEDVRRQEQRRVGVGKKTQSGEQRQGGGGRLWQLLHEEWMPTVLLFFSGRDVWCMTSRL